MASPTRALVWKEWREQRPIIITGLVLAAMMPLFLIAGASTMQRRLDLGDLANTLPVFFGMLMWPLIAAACGAATISSEIGDGTIGFLLSRPASRLRVWLVKVAVAAAALLVIVAGSLVVAQVFAWLAGARGGHSVLGPLGLPQDLESAEAFLLIRGVSGSVWLLFACAVFYSTFLSRAMTAAAGGTITALAVVALILGVWSRFDLVPRYEPGLVSVELGAAAILALLASLWVFTRGELLSGRGAVRNAAFGAVAAAVGLALFSVPVLLVHARLTASDAILVGPRVDAAGSAVAATAMDREGGSAQAWLVHLDGSGFERLGGRLTAAPVVSPDGSWVAYLSLRSPWGLRADAWSLRAVRTAGGGDRTLVADIVDLPAAFQYFYSDGLRFSPDGEHIAVTYGLSLLVASMSGGPPKIANLNDLGTGPAQAFGWTADGREVLLVGWNRDAPPSTSVWAYDPDLDRLRRVYSIEGQRAWIPDEPSARAGVTLLPLPVIGPERDGGDREVSVALVDVRDGSSTPLPDAGCGLGVDVGPQARRVAYASCREEEAGFEIRFRELDDGTEIAAGDLDGRAYRILLSPAGDWVAVERFAAEAGRLPAAAISAGGQVREFEEGWTPLGWNGRTGVILAKSVLGESGVRQLAVADVETGQIRPVFP